MLPTFYFILTKLQFCVPFRWSVDMLLKALNLIFIYYVYKEKLSWSKMFFHQRSDPSYRYNLHRILSDFRFYDFMWNEDQEKAQISISFIMDSLGCFNYSSQNCCFRNHLIISCKILLSQRFNKFEHILILFQYLFDNFVFFANLMLIPKFIVQKV